MSQGITVEDQEKQAREERKPKWMAAAGVVAVYTLASLASCFLLVRLSGLAIAVPVIVGLYGLIVTVGLARLSTGARAAGDVFMPLALGAVLGGWLYSPAPNAPIGVMVGVQLVLLLVAYFLYFRMWKGSTEEPDVRQAINSVLGKTAYPGEYESEASYKTAGIFLMVATILLQIGFVVFKDAELVVKANGEKRQVTIDGKAIDCNKDSFEDLSAYFEPMIAETRSLLESDANLKAKYAEGELNPENPDNVITIINTNDQVLDHLAKKNNTTMSAIKNKAFDYNNAKTAKGNLVTYEVALHLLFLPGFFAAFGLLNRRRWAHGMGDTYLGLSLGISLFLLLAFQSQIGPAGLVLPIISLIASVLGLRTVFKIERGVADADLKDVPAAQKSIEKAAESPAFSPEEFESWENWRKTGVIVLIMTFLEVVCLFIYNSDFFPRLSAAFSDGFGHHFPGAAFLSLLLSIVSGALCGVGLMNRWRGIKPVAEMRIALGPGQVVVYLLLSQLLVSDEIWRLFPFIFLVGLMIVAYVFLGKTRQNYYQA